MKLKCTISIFLTLVGLSLQAQKLYSNLSSPIPTDKQLSLTVPTTANILIDGTPVVDSVMIGAFYDSLGTEVIAGLEFFSDTVDREMVVFGNSDLTIAKDGFDDNEIMAFKIFDLRNSCVVENFDYVLQSGLVTWRESAVDTLLFWNGTKTFWGYNFASYCINDTDTILPFLSGEARNVSYTSSPAGLALDATTGAFVPSLSTPGDYTVTLNTQSCLVADTFRLTIDTINASITYDDPTACANDPGLYLPAVSNVPFATFASTPSGLDIDQFTGAISPSLSTPGKYTIEISTQACVADKTLSFAVSLANTVFSYQRDSLCQGINPFELPQFSSSFADSLFFSSTPAGLSLDATSGAVDVASSTPGLYSVVATTDACLANDTFELVVRPLDGNITYPETACIPQAEFVSPDINDLIDISQVRFNSSEQLSLDEESGIIDLTSSDAGFYIIGLETDLCLLNYETSISLEEQDFEFSYAQESYCRAEQTTVLALVSELKPSDLNFYSLPAGLSLDEETGNVDITNSTDGTYEVWVETAACQENDTLTFTIDPIATFVDYPRTDLCGSDDPTLAPVIAGDTSVSIEFNPIFPELIIDSNTGIIDVVNSFPGTYSVEFSSAGCLDKSQTEITIQQDSLVISYDTNVFCQVFVENAEPGSRTGLVPDDLIYRTNNQGLILDTIGGVIDPSASAPGTYQVFLFSKACLLDTVIEIEILEVDGSVSYAVTETCQTDDFLDPETTLNLDSISFFSIQDGLSIDASNGQIDPQNSSPGTFDIGFETDYCLSDTSFALTIYEGLMLFESDFTITPSICDSGTLGSIEQISLPSVGGTIDYVLIESVSLDQIEVSGEFSISGLPASNYLLQAEDPNGCSASLVLTIDSISCSEENTNTLTDDETIIVPGSVDAYGEVIVQCQGDVIYIYDRHATLIRTLENSQTWDGRNADGDLVSSGLYIFYCGENERIGEVTVLYR